MGARRFYRLTALFGAAALMLHLMSFVEEAEEQAAAADAALRHARRALSPRTIRGRLGFAAPTQAFLAGGSEVPGEVLMHFGPGLTADEVDARLARHHLTLLEWSPRLGAARVALPEGHAEGLLGVGGLPRPQANAVARAARARRGRGRQRPLKRALPRYAGTPAIIALLDTGVDLDHPRLNLTLREGANFVDEGAAPQDDNQHGTHLASIIDQLTHGRATVIPVKVLDGRATGTEFDIAQGIVYAVEQGARVINLSLSFGPSYTPSDAMREALRVAQAADVVLVAAAGNEGEGRVAYPAALPGVMAVGAADANGVRTGYSNYGAALDLLAPGGGDDARSEGIRGDTFALGRPRRHRRLRLSGTSMATAYASAVAAVVLGEAPGLGAPALRGALMASAVREGDVFEPRRGTGVLEPRAALRFVRRLRDPDRLVPTTVAATHVAIGQALQAPECAHTERVHPLLRRAMEADCAYDAERARAVVLVEILDGRLAPVAGARVWIDVDGSMVDQASCTTDTYGRCVVTSRYVADSVSQPAVFAARTAKVVLEDGRVAQPAPAQRLAADRAQVLDDALGQLPEPPIVLVEGIEADAATNSLFDGYRVLHSYEWRPVVFGDGGSDIAVALNDPFLAQLGAELPVHIVEGGIGLVSAGDADPLTWINDVKADVLAEGEGLWGSGMSPQLSFPLWSFDKLYDVPAGGAGLWGSGLVLDFSSAPWLFETMDVGGGFDAGGVGLWGSGWVPWSYIDFSFQTASGLSTPADGQVAVAQER